MALGNKPIRLKLKDGYRSIGGLAVGLLPKLTVITGKNGTGKSHLLEAIDQGHVSVEDIPPDRISLIRQEDFTKSMVKQKATNRTYQDFKAQQLQNLDAIIDDIDRRGGKLTKAERSKIVQIAKKEEMGLIDLDAAMIQDDNLRIRFEAMRNRARYFVDLHKQDFNHEYVRSIYFAGEQFFHDVDRDEYLKDSTISGSFDKGVLPEQLALVIYEYAYRKKKNIVHELENRYKGGSHDDVLSDLQFMNKYGPPPWELINELLQKFTDFRYLLHFDFTKFDPQETQFEVYFEDSQKSVVVYPQDLSSGEKTILSIVLSIFSASLNNNFPKLLLLDEVDAALHPSMCVSFVDALQTVFCKDNDLPVIVVTHSASTVAAAPEGAVQVLYRRNGLTTVEAASKGRALRILSEGFVGMTNEENQMVILHRVEDSNKHTIILEGPSDEMYIKEAFKRKGSTEFLNDVTITHADGYGGIDNVWKVLTTSFGKQINSGKKMILVYDCDERRKNEKHGKHARFTIEKIESNPISRGIENLISAELLAKIISALGSDAIYLDKTTSENKVNDAYKVDIAEWVVKNGTDDDFGHFIKLVDMIEEEYFS